MEHNVSILWDIENVTPSKGASFTDGLVEMAKKLGPLSSATAFGNWRGSLTNDLAVDLSENGFELVHIPRSATRGKAKKDSADFALTTRAIEMVFQYPHIKTYIILTGDIDFRALLQTLKKHGKRIVIVCDVKHVSENLLEYADEYLDYRTLLPGDASEEDDDSEETPNVSEVSRDMAFDMLSETVSIIQKEEKIANPGGVKVRMKLLNDNFSGDVEGYASWKAFINDAVKHKIVAREDTEKGVVLTLPEKKANREAVPAAFQGLLTAIGQSSQKDGFANFSAVAKKLKDNKVNIKEYNYNQFKKYVMDAEKRGLVEASNKGGSWFVKKAEK